MISQTAEPLPAGLSVDETAAYNKMFNLGRGSEMFPGRFKTYEELPIDAFLLPAVEGENVVLLEKTIHDALAGAGRKIYFSQHLPYSFFAMLVWLSFMFSRVPDPLGRWLLTAGSALAVGACHYADAMRLFLRWKLSAPDRQTRAVPLFMVLLLVWVLGAMADPDSLTFPISLTVIAILNLSLSILLLGPTRVGRKLLDAIAGYRDFLCSVEMDRMHRLKGPRWKPSAATANLAYAIGLDLGDAWDEYVANAGFRTVEWTPGA